MTTIGEEIDAWKKEFESADNDHKYWMQQLAAAQHFKAEKIWEYCKNVNVPKPKYME